MVIKIQNLLREHQRENKGKKISWKMICMIIYTMNAYTYARNRP